MSMQPDERQGRLTIMASMWPDLIVRREKILDAVSLAGTPWIWQLSDRELMGLRRSLNRRLKILEYPLIVVHINQFEGYFHIALLERARCN